DGVRIPAMPVEMARAFPQERLALLSAPALRMDHAADSITAFDTPAAVAAPARATARPGNIGRAALDFGEAIWNPAHSTNYSTAGNGRSAVIMHTIEGSYAGGISWFQNPAANVSAHYVIRRSDGQITQMVREHHQAWHAAYHNHYTIGIEHDGRAADA